METTEYLIKEYQPDWKPGMEPILHIVGRHIDKYKEKSTNLWYWLDMAKEGKVKISVYPIGENILDWS